MKKNLFSSLIVASIVLIACSEAAPVISPTPVAVTESPTAVTKIPATANAKIYEYKDMTVGFIQIGSESP